MLSNSVVKWIASLILAGVLLILSLFGGKWGTIYSADASVNAVPFIQYITPSYVPAGSPDRVMVITGNNFGNLFDTGVLFTSGGADTRIYPVDTVSLTRITIVVPSDMLLIPMNYFVRVLKSIVDWPPTVPTIPNPPEEQISNAVPFTVFAGQFFYLPLVYR